MERALPPAAMVFELPVADFPEIPPIERMSTYEHFRPYLFSHSLRFSYGSDKGRLREAWQSEATQFGIPSLIEALERYGFSAVLINRRGYADDGATVVEGFRSAGREERLAESQDFVCVTLHPALRPSLPPEFDQSWYGAEGNDHHIWRWSPGDAGVVVYNVDPVAREIEITCALESLRPRHVLIASMGEQHFDAKIGSGRDPSNVAFRMTVQPGPNRLVFRTDTPGELAGNGDTRVFAFRLIDFKAMY